MFPKGAIVRLHVWLEGGVTVGMCGSGVCGVGRGHGGMVGICTLGGGGVIFTLGGGGAVGTLGSGGVVGTLVSGGAGRPDRWVMAEIFGMDGCAGSANRIILAN